MENILLKYFIQNDELRNACDFQFSLLTEGPGIYEVIRLIDGKPLFLTEHLNRFFASAKYEKFEIEYSINEIREKIRLLIDRNKMLFGNIRFQFIMHPDLGKLFIAWAISYYYPSIKEQQDGVQIVSVEAVRENPHSKRTNLPVRFLAEKLIIEKNVSEVLMINNDGLITEGSRSNIFFIKNKSLFTPFAHLVLQGVTRDKIIRLASSNKIEVTEKIIRFDQISNFDACFLSSTSKSVLPVKQIDDHHFKVNNPLMKNVAGLYNRLVHNYLIEFKW